ncbi:MAG: L,D-transpeptidase family protein [Chthoniobacterales bacterium]
MHISTAQPAPKPVKKQKPASDLIQKQARPRVVPRVLDRATPDTTRILIRLGDQRAILLVGSEVAIDTPISSGKRAGMTPKGEFLIVQKHKDHRSNIYGNFVDRSGQIVRGGVSTRIDSAPSSTVFRGAPMQYFMRLGTNLEDYSPVGLHVGQLPGYPASHGCIRLPEDIAPLIFERVRRGTPVVIQD